MILKNIKNIEEDRFKIRIADQDSIPKIEFEGWMDTPSLGNIVMPFFQSIHDRLVDNNLDKVFCDLSQLKFINSANINCLVKWVSFIKTTPEEKRYKIIFLYNKPKFWQEKFLSVLRVFSRGAVELKSLSE